MTFSTDLRLGHPEFDLAIEFGPRRTSLRAPDVPREMTIWRATAKPNGDLGASLLRSFTVFRCGPLRRSLSLVGDSLLRCSYGTSKRTVLTVHHWSQAECDSVQHFILLPRGDNLPQDGVDLLPDGRIIIIFSGRVELYAPAKAPWEECPSIPEGIPLVAPQWVFEFQAPLYNRIKYSGSRLCYCPKKASATFAFHNGSSLFNLQVSLDNNSIPRVSNFALGQMNESDYVGIQMDRSIRTTLGEKEAVFTTASQGERHSALHSFANLTDDGSKLLDSGPIKRDFVAPFPSAAGAWELDEWSGHVLCSLAVKGPTSQQCGVLYFAD
ncbi:hypothetical protein M407DRAFT_168473 [Tulasnella calospora MUT 4182]|uniref:Uncharacterized protein n=1 Tax=Tulasnella calospora MUT 4182 TaxID=1051891 RepID=A0A0C3QNA1_9AGAM|nr:hypothetical protein M407DRAFT_168473 [Tulasnella calospora MUT 4182]